MSGGDPFNNPFADWQVGELIRKDQEAKRRANGGRTPGFEQSLVPNAGTMPRTPIGGPNMPSGPTMPPAAVAGPAAAPAQGSAQLEGLVAQFVQQTGLPEEQVRKLLGLPMIGSAIQAIGTANNGVPPDVLAAMQDTGGLGIAPPPVSAGPGGAVDPMALGMTSAPGARDLPPTGGGETPPVETPPAETPPAVPPAETPPAPVLDTSGNPPDTGWSSEVQKELIPDLYDNPIQAERVLLQQQGLDPNSTSPIIQARLRIAARSKGLYNLLYGAKAQPGDTSGFVQGDFLDWFKGYMENATTAGAAPMVTAKQAMELVNNAIKSASNPDNPWAKMLLNISGVDPANAIGYAPQPGDQSAAINNLLLSALGGIVDPNYLKALTESTDLAEQGWRTNQYDPSAGQPLDLSFLDYYLNNNPLGPLSGGTNG